MQVVWYVQGWICPQGRYVQGMSMSGVCWYVWGQVCPGSRYVQRGGYPPALRIGTSDSNRYGQQATFSTGMLSCFMVS